MGLIGWRLHFVASLTGISHTKLSQLHDRRLVKRVWRFVSLRVRSTMPVFGPECTSIIAAEANNASKGRTAGLTNKETTIDYCRGTWKRDFNYVKGNMKEGENKEEVDVNIEILSKILGDILNNS
ncbi:uncharacterized protein LY79DRAFT_546831 [Colletotrichum navitas]|uniref:Uncharacterized protein n=1 Tax=Colletotrichum navitas TaxID=681940 RepID=A0AAD8Q5P9_9PEZI|nr:uncharacterized protein LY79DRAFT_546831 [Colletotrichum navitas]KAK1595587.1 hypothetical protein LY79DRAFT_546831 [Colletotrichum navitas]